MRGMTFLIGGLVVVMAIAALVVFNLDRSDGGPADPAEATAAAISSSRPPPGTRGGPPGEGQDRAALPSPRRSDLEVLLERFDKMWAAPRGFQGRPYYEAIRRREAGVEVLAQEVADLGPDVVADIQVHLTDPATSYPRRTLLVAALSHLGSEEALRLLASVAVEGTRRPLRQLALRRLVESKSDHAMDVGIEAFPQLDDPLLLIPLLNAGWDPDRMEQAYREWMGTSPSMVRNQSYTHVAKVEGDWPGRVLQEVAASDHPARERAGAIQALAVRREEGTLYFLRDLLWVEEDPLVIRAIVGAIRRIGGEEGQEILKAYLAGGAPDELRDYVQRAAEAPTRMERLPTGEGEGGGPGVGSARADPERMRRLIGQ